MDELLGLSQHLAEMSEEYEDFLYKNLTDSGLLLSTVVQRSAAWHRARRGRLTASNFATIAGCSPYASPQSYWELITGRIEIERESHDIDRGVRLEPVALNWYKNMFPESSVIETGLWVSDSVPYLGASPDGLVSHDGILEIKCPRNSPHQQVPYWYMAQVQGQLHITNREWCDFVSYTETGGVQCFRIKRNLNYWNWLLPLLESFYFSFILDTPPSTGCTIKEAQNAAQWCLVEQIRLDEIKPY